MFVLKRSGSFVVGGSVGVFLVVNMDDMMYTQLQRHVIHPFRILIAKPTPIESREIMEVGQGASNFITQFKPKAAKRVSAKELLLDDGDYSTRQDHYFNYINRRLTEPQTGDFKKDQEKAVLKGLKLDTYLSDEFRQKIEDLEEDPEIVKERYAFMNQKHSKQEYAVLKDISVADIFQSVSEKKKQVKFDEDRMDRFQDMVKIEAKKQKLREKRSKKRQQDELIKKAAVQRELDEALSTPGLMQDPDKAMELIDKQDLTAKKLSKSDIKQLNKLRQNAIDFSDLEEVPSVTVQIQVQNDDASFIKEQVDIMDRRGVFEQGPTKKDLQMEQEMLQFEKDREDKANPKPSIAEIMHQRRASDWRKKQNKQ